MKIDSGLDQTFSEKKVQLADREWFYSLEMPTPTQRLTGKGWRQKTEKTASPLNSFPSKH